MAELTPEQARDAALVAAAAARATALAAAKQEYDTATSGATTAYQQAVNAAEAAYQGRHDQQAEALAVFVADANLMALYNTAAADLPAYLAAIAQLPPEQTIPVLVKAVWCLVRMKGATL